MGMDLHSETGAEFRLSRNAWLHILELAKEYGWEPLGTIPPTFDDPLRNLEYKGWEGGYDTNEFQIVTDVDSAEMASALENALQDIASQEEALLLAGFISFAKKGSFSID